MILLLKCALKVGSEYTRITPQPELEDDLLAILDETVVVVERNSLLGSIFARDYMVIRVLESRV